MLARLFTNHRKLILGLIIVLVVGIGVAFASRSQLNLPFFARTADPQDSDKIITANLVDPTQIQSISKFRSCAGHEYFTSPDYSGQPEGDSNMKLYFSPISRYLNTTNALKLDSPFDSTVHIFSLAGSTGSGMILERQPFDGWYAEVFHIDPPVSDGATVKAGDLLGYAHMVNERAFDFVLQRFKTEVDPRRHQQDEFLTKNTEPVFSHMTDALLAQWATHGITADNTVVDRSYRLANPCQCAKNQPYDPAAATSHFCHFEPTPGDSVTVSQ